MKSETSCVTWEYWSTMTWEREGGIPFFVIRSTSIEYCLPTTRKGEEIVENRLFIENIGVPVQIGAQA